MVGQPAIEIQSDIGESLATGFDLSCLKTNIELGVVDTGHTTGQRQFADTVFLKRHPVAVQGKVKLRRLEAAAGRDVTG